MATLNLSDAVLEKLTTLALSRNMTVSDLLADVADNYPQVLADSQNIEAYEQLKLATSVARMGIWMLDLQTDILTWNDELLNIYGITRHEFDNTLVNWEQYVHPNDVQYATSRLSQASEGKAVFDVQFRIVRPDGELRYINGSATPLLDDDGNVIKVIGNNIDITSIKIAEDKLLDQDNILKHVTDAIITTDTEFRILTWNHRAEEMYGWRVDEVIGKRMGNIVKSEYTNTTTEDAIVELSGKGHWQGEVTQLSRSGQRLHVMASVSAIRDDEGELRGYVAVNRDISAKKRSEQLQVDHEVMQQQLDKEHELAEWRATMMSTIAHELRTPLSVVMFSADMLVQFADRLSPEKQKDHLQKVTFHAKRLDTMIDELNLLARAERGYLETNFEQINIQVFCEALIDNFRPLLLDSHQLRLTIDPSVTHISMDAKLMKMAVSNLLTNAIKYSPDGGLIELRIKSENGRVTFIVRDEGLGIPDKDQDMLLRPFKRATNVKHIRGSGLGLSIVREVVKQHAGDIDFQSTVGEGTTFRLWIPNNRPAG